MCWTVCRPSWGSRQCLTSPWWWSTSRAWRGTSSPFSIPVIHWPRLVLLIDGSHWSSEWSFVESWCEAITDIKGYWSQQGGWIKHFLLRDFMETAFQLSSLNSWLQSVAGREVKTGRLCPWPMINDVSYPSSCWRWTSPKKPESLLYPCILDLHKVLNIH